LRLRYRSPSAVADACVHAGSRLIATQQVQKMQTVIAVKSCHAVPVAPRVSQSCQKLSSGMPSSRGASVIKAVKSCHGHGQPNRAVKSCHLVRGSHAGGQSCQKLSSLAAATWGQKLSKAVMRRGKMLRVARRSLSKSEHLAHLAVISMACQICHDAGASDEQ
jgi:hypothetical protein